MIMNEILENLYLGDEQDAEDFWLSQESLYTSFDLRGWKLDLEGVTDEHVKFLTILADTIEFARSLGPVLVYCHAGMDRSPFAVAVYITLKYGLIAPEHAYELVKQSRSQIIIHDDWMRDFIQKHEGSME